MERKRVRNEREGGGGIGIVKYGANRKKRGKRRKKEVKEEKEEKEVQGQK